MKGLVEIIIFVSPQDRAPVSRGGLPDVSVLAGPGAALPPGQGTVLYCTVLYCTLLYCTVLDRTVLYCTVLGAAYGAGPGEVAPVRQQHHQAGAGAHHRVMARAASQVRRRSD